MRIRTILISIFCLFFLASNAQDSRLKKFKNLSGPEKCWVIFHPFKAKKALAVREKARLKTKEIQKQNVLKDYFNGNGDQLDAFRHTFWMAKLTLEIGARRAKKLGKAHEKGNYKDYKKRRLEDGSIPDKISSEMDLYNNDVGIAIGNKSGNFELDQIIVEAVLLGKCKIVRVDKDLNYLDIEGIVIPKEELKGKWENDKCLMWSNEPPE